ncbi:hypothetical protein [Amycolatopsis dongchuanensis]|uniref:Uncharacterized protein n=1 Tax=Amycolatopsis dongchuanensis TaxID=1070866 RepID=A0ABP9QJC6_9PSEU
MAPYRLLPRGGPVDLCNRAALAALVRTGPDWYARTVNYLRLPRARLDELRNSLLALGMACDGAALGCPPPRLPEPRRFGLVPVRDEFGFPVWTGRRCAEFAAAQARALAVGLPPGVPGIPVHKLTDGGWLVSRAECASALAAYRRARARGTPHPRSFGDDFVTFLTACAGASGFVVGRAVTARPAQALLDVS